MSYATENVNIKKEDHTTNKKEQSHILEHVHSDIYFEQFPEIDWSDKRLALDKLARHAVHNVQKIIRWYLDKKEQKRKWAQRFRLTAIVFGAFAAMSPAIVGMIPSDSLRGTLAFLAPIFTAISAGFIGIDKFFGFSSGWMRYINTELKIQTLLKQFEHQWLQEQLYLTESELTVEKTSGLLCMIWELSHAVDETMAQETIQWMEEFQGRVLKTEQRSQPLSETTQNTNHSAYFDGKK